MRTPSMRGKPVLSRRAMLRGALGLGAVTVGLPWLEAMQGTARAASVGLPRRFGVFSWGNGVLPDRWVPTGPEDAWVPSLLLEPLDPVRQHLTVITGMEVRVPNTIPHFSGPAGMLTGQLPIGVEGDNTVAAPTIDQVIAAEIGGETRYRSLELGAERGLAGYSFNGPNARNPAETSPAAFFDRLFGPSFRAPGEDVPPDPRLALRRSVLDAVTGQIDRLNARVGASDRARLDQHLTGVRELELRLARMEEDPPSLAACVRPEAPAADETFEAIAARNAVMADLLAMALACDQSRVFTYGLCGPVSNHLWPATDTGHHQLTHDEVGDQPQVEAITLQIMAELRVFIEALAAVPEGDGTLLDACAVLCTSEISFGRTHGLDEFPIIVAGSACGALRQGLHLRSETRESVATVMLSLMRAVGINAASWGVGDAGSTRGFARMEA